MKLKLTGTYEQTTYKWEQSIEQHIHHGTAIVPIKVTLTTENGLARFSIIRYDGFNYDQDPSIAMTKHVGKFQGMDLEPAYRQWNDNSGGAWESLTWVGEYISWAQKCCEFQISRHIDSLFTDVHAVWPHKKYDYPRAPIDMVMRSTIFDIDEKSKSVLEELFGQYRI